MWRLLLLKTLTVLLLVKHSTDALTATIRTDPDSPPYPAATWILFACEVENAAVGIVYYNWTVSCSHLSPPLIVAHLTDNSDIGTLSLRVRSTPGFCADMVVCNVNDTTGNTASATLQITQVTGVGFWGPVEPIRNNGAYLADVTGDIGTIHCHSSSRDSNVGRWIAPSGEDITNNHLDSFVIQFTNGPYSPSFSSLELLNPSSDPFIADNEGVYSCVVPDENGDLQTVNIGLYTSTHSNVLTLSDAQRISESPLILNCATSGLPSSVVEWRRSGDALSAGSSYQMTKVITNRHTSSYDNMLTVNLATDAASGFYECLVQSKVYDGPSQTTVMSSNVVRHTFVVLIVGSSERVTCSLSDTSFVTWENEDDIVLVEGNVLPLSANDSVHEKTYSCRGYLDASRTTLIKELNIKPIITVPDSVLYVTASSNDGTPVLGQQYTIICLAAKTVGGLVNLPTVELVLSNGTVLTLAADGITFIERVVGATAKEVSMTVLVLYTSQAGRYTCRGSLHSPARSSIIVADEAFNVTVQLPTPSTVTLSSSDTSPNLLPGSSVSLQCRMTVSALINTPFSVLFTWSKTNGDTLINTDRITISRAEPVNAFTYQSTLSIDRLNRSLDSNALITCSVRVVSVSNEEHLLPSNTITSQGHLINVVGIIITTNAIGSPNLQTGNGTYTLVCTVTEEEDINGVPTVNWIGPDAQTLETSSSDDITLTRQVSGLTTMVSLHFNPLRASHGGEYTCRAVLATVGFDELKTIDLEVEVGNLHVVIEATSSGADYRVGSSLQLTCGVAADSNVLPVGGLTYSWSTTCSGECFVSDQTTSSIGRDVLRAADSGTHTCTITDSIGNYGRASTVVVVTGVAIYHSELGLLNNNSVIRRNDDDEFGTLFCLSGSTTPSVGWWVAPNGDDLTQVGLHPFRVNIGGENNPGFVNLSVIEDMFDDVYQGVYSCVIPDERGEIKTIHLGVHTSGEPIPLIASLAPSSHHLSSHFTLNCSSIYSAATEVSWSRAGTTISADSAGYQTVQLLRNGTTSTYDNLLLFTTPNPNELVGVYSCLVRNSFGQQQMEISLQGISIVASIEVFYLDTMASFTCTSDLGVESISWFFDGQLLTSSSGSEGVLTLQSVTDSMHNSQYTCRAVATFGTQEHRVNVLVEVDAERDLSIETTPSTDLPVSHEPFSITCTITKSIGLQNTPSIEWLDAMGNVLTTSESDGIVLSNPVTLGQTSNRTIQLNSFTKALHREFTCRSTITSSAPPFTLTKIAVWEYLEGRNGETTASTEPRTTVTTTTTTDISCDRMFQLVLGKVNFCQEWTFQSAEEKQNDIITKLAAEIRQLCPSCDVETLNFIDLEFSCPEKGDKQFVLFRATISSLDPQHCERTLMTITEWVQRGGVSLLILTNRLYINSSCDVEIETRSSILRCSETTGPKSSASSAVEAGGAGGGAAVLLAVIVVVGLVICFFRRKKKRHSATMGLPGSGHGAPNTVNEAYGMFSALQNPYYSNSIQGPDLPPCNDLYSTPRGATVMSNMKKSDSYIMMDPAGTFGMGAKILDELYAEIPPVNGGENVYERVGEEHWPQGERDREYTNIVRESAEDSGAHA